LHAERPSRPGGNLLSDPPASTVDVKTHPAEAANPDDSSAAPNPLDPSTQRDQKKAPAANGRFGTCQSRYHLAGDSCLES
jgi:hypothetical protein